MTRVFDIAHEYVDELAALDPCLATSLGLPGHEREMTNFSLDGYEAIAALNRETLGAIGKGQRATLREPQSERNANERDRIAAEVMGERLGVRLDVFEAGEH